ncbi:hypothetical protein TNCV_3362321 [Trichonephila clavipes]|nr:hypothetical protein TNCV_3362321 [Trichonephila clavipes]
MATVDRKRLIFGACVGHLQVWKNEKEENGTEEKERARKRRGLVVLGSEARRIPEFWAVMLTRNPERE